MGFLNLFKNRVSKKGEETADFIISLGAEGDFKQLVMSTPKLMALRLMIDSILVRSGIASFAIWLSTRERPDDFERFYDSMMDRLCFHVEKMSDAAGAFNIKDIIVDEDEKAILLRNGYALNEMTSIYNVFSVIGDYRMEKYRQAVAEGFIESTEELDGMRLTAKLMQETKKSCGENDFPYAELKVIYSHWTFETISKCNSTKK